MRVEVDTECVVHLSDMKITAMTEEDPVVITLGKPTRNSVDGVIINKSSPNKHVFISVDPLSDVSLRTSDEEDITSLVIGREKSRDVHLKYKDSVWRLMRDQEKQ